MTNNAFTETTFVLECSWYIDFLVSVEEAIQENFLNRKQGKVTADSKKM